jgi:hypothetical protein
MDDPIADLERRMAEAMEAENYEAAADLRDQIRVLRGEAPVPGSRLRREGLDELGQDTNRRALAPRTNWKAPPRPDPMTSGYKPRKGGR